MAVGSTIAEIMFQPSDGEPENRVLTAPSASSVSTSPMITEIVICGHGNAFWKLEGGYEGRCLLCGELGSYEEQISYNHRTDLQVIFHANDSHTS